MKTELVGVKWIREKMKGVLGEGKRVMRWIRGGGGDGGGKGRRRERGKVED